MACGQTGDVAHRLCFSLSRVEEFINALATTTFKRAYCPLGMLVNLLKAITDSAFFLLPMISFLRLSITFVVFALSLPILRADSSAFVLPPGDSLATLALPEGLKVGNVSIAISKALVANGWENLGWEGSVTIADIKKSRVNIKVFAVAAAAEVKLYATYSAENNKTTEERCRQVAVRELRGLEQTIAEKLELIFRKAKGEATVDRAEAG